MKLARKIIVLTLAMFLGVLAVLGWVDARRAVRAYHASVATELVVTGRALRAPLAEVMLVEGEGRARKLIEAADSDIADMDIRWLSIAAPSASLDASAITKLQRGEEISREDRGGDGRAMVFVPVPSAGGAIEVSRSLGEERAVVRGIVEDRLLVGGLAVLAAALLSVFAGVRIVGEPMRELTQHARRIGAGDLSRREAPRRNDEIGELATEMNGMCDRLTKAMQQLRHADRLTTVGTLASGMAHELGTPLAVIGGRAKMITAGARGDDVLEYAKVISAQVDRMTKIMRGLLDFARRSPPTKSRTDLGEVVRRILDLLGPLAKKHGVDLNLAPGSQSATIDADAAQVEQAVANLVVNAVQSIERGGTVTVDVTQTRATAPGSTDARDYVRVTVRDSGRGIAEKDLPHVFEPFFTTKDVGEGTGLGLSVTYGIVHEHAGFVDVESTVGRGSVFSLYFPA